MNHAWFPEPTGARGPLQTLVAVGLGRSLGTVLNSRPLRGNLGLAPHLPRTQGGAGRGPAGGGASPGAGRARLGRPLGLGFSRVSQPQPSVLHPTCSWCPNASPSPSPRWPVYSSPQPLQVSSPFGAHLASSAGSSGPAVGPGRRRFNSAHAAPRSDTALKRRHPAARGLLAFGAR
jgi:hypothetical protein